MNQIDRLGTLTTECCQEIKEALENIESLQVKLESKTISFQTFMNGLKADFVTIAESEASRRVNAAVAEEREAIIKEAEDYVPPRARELYAMDAFDPVRMRLGRNSLMEGLAILELIAAIRQREER